MALSIGLVGLPNAGKSTLLNALTNLQVTTASYPFTTIEPNIGMVPVEDERLDQLAELIKPERRVAATVEFVDVAGLVKGASRGEGLGAQFLGHLRNVDAIAMVLRVFQSTDVSHTLGGTDPERDADVLWLDRMIIGFRPQLLRRFWLARSGRLSNRPAPAFQHSASRPIRRQGGSPRDRHSREDRRGGWRSQRATATADRQSCRSSGAQDATADGQAGHVRSQHR